MSVLLFLLGPVLFAIVVALGIHGTSRWRARSAHRRVLSELEARAAKRLDRVGLLRGTLHVENDGCPREDTDGPRKVAARTHWGSVERFALSKATPSTNERAPKLWLIGADKTKHRFQGPVAVELGSTLVGRGARSYVDHEKRFDLATQVFDGDEVWVLCVRSEEADDDSASGSYRKGASRGLIDALPEKGYSRIASTRPPSLSRGRRALARHPAILVAALLGGIPGWAWSQSYVTARSDRSNECARSGRCHIDTRLRWEGLRLSSLLDTLLIEAFVVKSHDVSECLRSERCAQWGECSLSRGECVAATNDDCRYAVTCMTGNCTASSGQCGVGRDTDCEKLSACRELGSCSAVDGACAIAKDADCRRTPGCSDEGLCSARGGQCVAARDEDCANATVCLEKGACHVVLGTCHKGNDACAGSPECLDHGRCSTRNDHCVAESDEGCRNSSGCAERGLCKLGMGLKGPQCVGSAVSCAGSEACRSSGRCKTDGFLCLAQSDADCAASEGCKQHGACKRIGNECAASCESTVMCRREGRCTPAKGSCVAGSGADCRKSEACSLHQRCALVEGECRTTDEVCAATDGCRRSGACSEDQRGAECAAREATDCESSRDCREKGFCTVVGYRCGVVSGADCARTEACESEGKCTFVANAMYGGSCEVGEDDCRKRAVCKELGACTLARGDDGSTCVATRDEDCRASLVCEKRGWCSLSDGRCMGQPLDRSELYGF